MSEMRNKDNDKYFLYTSIILLLIIIILSIWMINGDCHQGSSDTQEKAKYAFKQENINVVVSNPGLYEINTEDLQQLLEKNSISYVYIGRPTCPYCAKFQPILNRFLVGNGRSMPYFNTDNVKDKEQNLYESLVKKLCVTMIPIGLKINKGQLIDRYIDGFDEPGLQNWLRKNK
ncbi:hypothetical protein [Bacillus sp. 1P06AnD]|uniref:hypothetical protein n=1 Tax=Bacillus sp. 1P06AnD TaxID=3132208 RepID=UPI0039A1B232